MMQDELTSCTLWLPKALLLEASWSLVLPKPGTQVDMALKSSRGSGVWRLRAAARLAPSWRENGKSGCDHCSQGRQAAQRMFNQQLCCGSSSCSSVRIVVGNSSRSRAAVAAAAAAAAGVVMWWSWWQRQKG